MPATTDRAKFLQQEREKHPPEMRQAMALEQIADTIGRILNELIAIRATAQAPQLPPGLRQRM